MENKTKRNPTTTTTKKNPTHLLLLLGMGRNKNTHTRSRPASRGRTRSWKRTHSQDPGTHSLPDKIGLIRTGGIHPSKANTYLVKGNMIYN